ncbi:MAG: hypothetical protein ACYCZR_03955 [Burkholderiales bacterium]
MNTKQMQAALAKINPKSKAVAVEHVTVAQRVATTIGAVPSGTLGFFADIGTSFKYHEAKRKGLI